MGVDLTLLSDNWENKAVFGFIKELPDDWPVVLYWH